MEVRKESNGLKNSMVTREELAIINRFTKRALKEDEVYTFAVRLCDNEVDRDGERFPRATLEVVILTHSLPYSEIYAEIISLLEKLIYINKYEKGFYQLDCKILLLEILSNILSIPDILVKKTSNASDMRREIITYVNDNYLEKITLSDLADEFHMSEKYISRYFKKHFNITFSKYVNHMRLLYAKNLLDTTNISITDVALSSGFPNVSYFIRSFKESYGKTPFSYRTDNISVDM